MLYMSNNKEKGEKYTDNKTIPNKNNDEEYVGRDWSKVFMLFLIVFIVTVAWYVLKALTGMG